MGSGVAVDVCGGFLRSLCEDLAWDYAVFWKIRHQIPMFLSWEDGYCNHPRSKVLPKFALDAAYVDGEADVLSLLEEASTYSLGPLVSDLSSLCYYVGEGLVGDVAETGDHCWLLCDDMLFSINSTMLAAIPQEWLPQLSTGIKTVLLVPVLPYGVLQLGSLDMVAEDITVVTQVTEKFLSWQNVLSQSRIYLEPEDVQDLLLIPLASCLSDDTGDALSIIEKNLMSTVDLIEEESILNFEEISATFTHLEENLSASMDDNLAGSLFSSEEKHTFEDTYTRGLYGMDADYCASSDLIAMTYVDEVLNDIKDDILGNFLGFSKDWHLGEAFVSNILTQEKNVAFYNKDEDDYPLKAHSRDLTSNRSNSPIELGNLDSPTETAEKSSKWKYEPEEREDSVEHSVTSAAFSARTQDNPWESSMSFSKLQRGPDIVNGRGQLVRVSSNDADQEKQEQAKRMTGCKRKARTGDIPRPRPRPRDRQLIQDRVKELRELIPDGSKCSIDGLLAQTVRHMLFLRSVTSRVKKLRECIHSEESGWNQPRDSEIATESQSGSTWAPEIAGEQQVCPIVVEDLEYPGLMLIEMLCNDHGLFLEIAEVLRRLELNIVRGTTEARRDNTWASFVVEASKGFHRIDIFWPLMQLLQRTRNPPPAPSSLLSTIA